MGWFNRRAMEEARALKREEEADRLKLESLQRLKKAEMETKNLNGLLAAASDDASFRIFLGTGGDRRMKK